MWPEDLIAGNGARLFEEMVTMASRGDVTVPASAAFPSNPARADRSGAAESIGSAHVSPCSVFTIRADAKVTHIPLTVEMRSSRSKTPSGVSSAVSTESGSSSNLVRPTGLIGLHLHGGGDDPLFGRP